MKKRTSRHIIAIVFVSIFLGGSIFLVLRSKFNADTSPDTLVNQTIVSYLDADQKNVNFYATSSTQKVFIPLLALDPNINKRRAPVRLTIADSNSNSLDEIVLLFDNENKSPVDWTVVNSIVPEQRYNLTIKIPGYLSKHLNSVNLNTSSTIIPGQLYAGNANGDNIINIRDFSILMATWGGSSINSDFNGDNIINIRDLSVMMANWEKVEG